MHMQQAKGPTTNDKYRWTAHVQRKMRFYGLSPSRVLRVIRAPQRVEDGVAPETFAGMQKAGTPKKPWEVWVMWRPEKMNSKIHPERRVIITAWRYPGTSPVRSAVPIPAGVLEELRTEGLLADDA
jgi:hypothetical protein